MMVLSIVGLVVLVAFIVTGAVWILKNVNFNETKEKEDTK